MSEVFVRPGEPVQEALDAVGAGATVRLAEGEYAGSLWIKHGGVSLVGAGAGRTVLVPGSGAPPGIPPLHEAQGDVLSGISVHEVADVTVRGLSLRGFSGAGVYAHTVSGLLLDDLEALDNAIWGLYIRESTGCEVTSCRASGSQYAGVALSFCKEADALVAGNETFGNAFGIFLDNSSKVRLLRNTCHGNAAGILAINQTYEGEPEGGVADCLIADNDLYGNRLASGSTPGGIGEAGPPISGVGLALIGGQRVSVVGNHVHDNHPSGPSVMGSAFVVASSKEWGGDDAFDNHILWNRVTGNSPLDFQIGGDPEAHTFLANFAGAGEPSNLAGWSGP
ncbi:right-handed parallel beta-helix repeat-containing protein [Spongiactinospora sp. 9N601]|uniref:right-handed parallel beta-helix repeat-containing protein n=1 Tax=Spongiactinospora sp. 9N601 TaxID=3375149 RepID=UPI0037A72B97